MGKKAMQLGFIIFTVACGIGAYFTVKQAEVVDECREKGRRSGFETEYAGRECWVRLDKDTVIPWERGLELMMFNYTARVMKKQENIELAREQVLLGPPSHKGRK